MDKTSRILVLGHRGLVGSAIVRALVADGYPEPITSDVELTVAIDVIRAFADVKPEYVFLAAARVGGIQDNIDHGADILFLNLALQLNVIRAAQSVGIKKLLFLGSSCIYPRNETGAIHESALMTGPLEPTNEPYAMAKLAGITLLRAYRRQYGLNGIVAMPCNLYGPGDRFDAERSHMVPALMLAAHKAKMEGARHMTVWGTGMPRRELMHADDCARACVKLMEVYDDPEPINVGVGHDWAVIRIAQMIADAVGFMGEIRFDASRPEGVFRKVLNVDRIRALGWVPRIGLEKGLAETYAWMQEAVCSKQ
jgi:GDP-L-fucose synthase